MGIFSRVFSGGDHGRGLAEYVSNWLAGNDSPPVLTESGAAVTENIALSVTTVYACVNIIATTLASLPLVVFKQLNPRGREQDLSSPAYSILHDTPNPEQTSFDWRRLTAVHQLLWGAGISEIEFGPDGQPVALWPIPPWRVKVLLSDDGRSPVYEVTLPSGGKYRLLAYQVVVFAAMGTEAYQWKSPISVHRENIGYALALRKFGASTFGQGTNPAGVVTYPGKVTEGTEQTLRSDLRQYEGLSRSHRVMLLQDGMKFERIGLPPEDAQYLQSQSWAVSDIARIYNVPLHMLQSHEKATTWGSGLEELNSGFLVFTIRPYLVQWEQEFNRRVVFKKETGNFAEFIFAGLLRAKTKERFEAYGMARRDGWMSANEIRKLENLNPLPGEQGDTYLVPLNMQDAKDVGKDEPTK